MQLAVSADQCRMHTASSTIPKIKHVAAAAAYMDQLPCPYFPYFNKCFAAALLAEAPLLRPLFLLVPPALRRPIKPAPPMASSSAASAELASDLFASPNAVLFLTSSTSSKSFVKP